MSDAEHVTGPDNAMNFDNQYYYMYKFFGETPLGHGVLRIDMAKPELKELWCMFKDETDALNFIQHKNIIEVG